MNTKSFYTTVTVVVVTLLIIFMGFGLVNKLVDNKLVDKVKEPVKPESEQVIEEVMGQNPVIQEVRDPRTNKWMYMISKVEFEGHTYIVLEDHGTAILHDPDCQCQTQK